MMIETGLGGVCFLVTGFGGDLLEEMLILTMDLLLVLLAGESRLKFPVASSSCWILPLRSSSSVNSVAGRNCVSAG